MEARTGRRARGAGGTAVAIALGVVLVEVLLVGAWVTFLLVDEGWSRTVWLVIGVLVLWRLVPRPARLGPRAVTLTTEEAPGLHRLLAAVSDRLGSRAPSRVAVDTTYPIAAYATGYLGRTTLVVGLPQWTALEPDERLAALTHELACVRARARPAGCLVRLADDLLTAARSVLTPVPVVRADEAAISQSVAGYGEIGPGGLLVANRLGRETAAAVGGAGLSVLGAPVRAVQGALHRSWRRVLVAAALDADAAAARLAGVDGVLSMVASTVSVPRGLTAARNAARSHRGEDAFLALDVALRPDPDEVERLLTQAGEARLDEWHPRTADRVTAVRAAGGPDGREPGEDLTAADVEVAAVRGRFLARLTEELVHGRP